MSEQNKGGRQNTSENPQNQKRSGQETLGKRGQKADKRNEEHYRSGDQKRQRGNHGGNR